MTAFDATLTDAGAVARWTEWQAKGLEGDRRRTLRIDDIATTVVTVIAIWALIRLSY